VVQTSRGRQPASPHRTSWRCMLNRWGCVFGGCRRWWSEARPQTVGRSFLEKCWGNLVAECPCTENPYSARHGRSPPPLQLVILISNTSVGSTRIQTRTSNWPRASLCFKERKLLSFYSEMFFGQISDSIELKTKNVAPFPVTGLFAVSNRLSRLKSTLHW